MLFYSLLAILAALLGANAESTPCSKQIELEMRCLFNIESSPEATMVRDRMKRAMKTCAPDYPAECHAQMEAGHDCAVSTFKNADNDPLLIESKAKSQPAMDQCFVQNPPNVKKGIMEIFTMMKKHHGPPRFKRWESNNETNASGESASGEKASGEKASGESASGESASGEDLGNGTSSFERRRHHGGGGRGGGGRGGGGRGGHGGHGGHGGRGRHGRHCRPHHKGHHHRPGNFSSSEWGNDTSASSEASASGSASASRERMGKGHGMRNPKCQKTPEQHKCMKTELQKWATEAAFIDVINTLIRQKHKCKQIVDWSCSPKCHKRKKCIFKATKPCRDVFMTRMKTCLEQKGFTLPPMFDRGTTFTTPLPVLQD